MKRMKFLNSKKVVKDKTNKEIISTVNKNSNSNVNEGIVDKNQEENKNTNLSEEYANNFFLYQKILTRVGVYIEKDLHEALQTITYMSPTKMSLSLLLNNIIRNHLEVYEKHLEELSIENKKKVLRLFK